MKSRSRRNFFFWESSSRPKYLPQKQSSSKSKLRVTVLALNTTVNTDPELIRRLNQSITAQKHNIIFVLLNVSICVFVSPLYTLYFVRNIFHSEIYCTKLKIPIVKHDQGRHVAVCVHIDFSTRRAGQTTIHISMKAKCLLGTVKPLF